jgi:CubicO group peptidase (beta-lactamase class C family)
LLACVAVGCANERLDAPDDSDEGASPASTRASTDAGALDARARDASDAAARRADASDPPKTEPDAGSTGPTSSARPTSCNGMPLPPRAIGKPGPFAIGPEAAGLTPYWPTVSWKSETPDKLGFDPAKLAAAVDYKTPYSSSEAVLVIRHGYVAAEKYFGAFRSTSTHESYSMAKSFSSGLVGIAIAEGKLGSTEDRVCASYPMQWNCADSADARSRITIAHAMNLTSGLRWSEDWRTTATGSNDAYSLNLLDTVLARKTVEEPGVHKRYSTGDPSLLSGVLQKATGMTALAYAKKKIFDVIGTPSVRWNQDSKGRTTTYAGLQSTARDYAKYGYLYLHAGNWDGTQVIPRDWVEKTTRGAAPCDDWNQWLWHVNPPVRLGKQDPACDSLYCPPTDLADLPPDAFFAEGVNGQFLFVIPSSDMVVVRLANDTPGLEHWDEFARGFLGAVLDAVR